MSLINNRFSFVDRKNPLNFAAPDPSRDGMRGCADGMTDGGRLLSLGVLPAVGLNGYRKSTASLPGMMRNEWTIKIK